MSLEVSIIKFSDSVNVTESTKSFEVQGGTIGRGSENSWVLEDPERYLSTCHCQISHENGQYYITDLSTNGTFYNGSPNPIGKGSKLVLNDGDTFIVGDYEFSVSHSTLAGSSEPLMGNSSDPFASNSFDSPLAGNNSFSEGLGSASDPFASAQAFPNEPLFAETPAETDPLAALDKVQGKQQDANNGLFGDSNAFETSASSDPFANSSYSDQASPLNQQISWPESAPEQSSSNQSAIPDDWDDNFSSIQPPGSVQPAKSIPLTTPPIMPTPGRGSAQNNSAQSFSSAELQQSAQASNTIDNPTDQRHDLLQKENATLKTELKQLKQQLSSQQQLRNSDISVDTSLIESLGLQAHNLNESDITKINLQAGEVIKEMVKGLMKVLGSRGSIKNEFRMHVTTIQPVENNPIKFSANVEDALENMFVKRGNSYMKPLQSVEEGFDSVAEHQIAVLAGIKSAFKGVIERFDPALLEERFSKQNKGGFIPGSQKAKNWDLYQDYFTELAGDIDNSFQYLFGDDFVRAYEDQLQKMTISKKAKRSTTDK